MNAEALNCWANVALAVFVAVIAGAVAGLLYDLSLLWRGLATITDQVEDAPWLGVVLAGLILVGAAGLALHFWLRCRIGG